MESGSYWSAIADGRISRRRALAASGAAALGGAVLAACGSDGGGKSSDRSGLVSQPEDTSKSARRGGSMLSYRDREVGSADPYFTSRTAPGTAFTYSRLFRRKPGHLGPQPSESIGDLVESWEFSGDRLTLTIKLRPKAKWHNLPPLNGRGVDSRDVEYSWRRLAAVGVNRELLANAANPSAPIESMQPVDDQTVSIKLARPTGGLLGLLSGTISGYLWLLPRESEDKYDLRQTVIGSGPWMVSEYQPSIHLIFRRHEGWYDADHLYIDEVRQPIVPEYAAGLAQFKGGRIYDFAVRGEDVLATKRDVPALSLYLIDPASQAQGTFFGWNPTYGGGTPFRDKRLRQALSMSIDRDLWISTFFNVEAFQSQGFPIETAWNSSMTSTWPGYWLDPRGKDLGAAARYYRHDPAEAAKLVAAAGLASSNRIKAQYVTTGEYGTDFNARVETILNFASEAGISMVTSPVNWATEWRPKVADAQGDFEGISFRAIANLTIPDPVEASFGVYHSQAGAGYTGFFSDGSSFRGGDPKLDDLLSRARSELSEPRRQSLMQDVQRLLADNMYLVLFPGSASTLDLVWPTLRNANVYRGNLAHANIWLDPTRPPQA